MTTFSGSEGSDWAEEYLATHQVIDLARDPDDFRVTRQSAVTVNGLLVPVGKDDGAELEFLFTLYEMAFLYYKTRTIIAAPQDGGLTATMLAALKRSAARAKEPPDFTYISIDPRDYTIFTAPGLDIPVVSIHTRPERCWFLGVLRFEGALGLSLGRMRVSRPTEAGLYPITIRTKWRALTNKMKQEEVRDAYQRLTR